MLADTSAVVYARGDTTLTQRPGTFTEVPSSYAVAAAQKAQGAAVGLTAAIAVGIIFLLSRLK